MTVTARHTYFVAWSKNLLWVLAATIVGAVIWIASDGSDNGARIVFSSVPNSGNLQNIMTHPHFQGVDAHNRPYNIIADTATQIDADHVSMVSVRSDMTLSNGVWTALNAGSGLLDMHGKQMELRGGVDMFYDGGYEFRTDHAHVDIQKGSAAGDAHIEGQGPPGTLTADSFAIDDKGQVIHFNGSVRMTLYR